jgi:KamA family protein
VHLAIEPRAFRPYHLRDLDKIPQFQKLSPERRLAVRAVASVLPFRVNSYVVDELIDWDRVPEDPIFQLTFPQPEMLAPEDLEQMVGLLRREAPQAEITAAARAIQVRLNPHPAGQRDLNVPSLDGEPLPGMQHKYRETVLFFPQQGQTCHSYCTYCFRWAQFVGMDELKFANSQAEMLARYLKRHRYVTDVLFTGGDPLVMRTEVLARYIDPLLAPDLAHVGQIRLGTKAPAYWPHRFVTDRDADDLLRLFERVVRAGRHLAVMAHFSHPTELSTPVAEEAIRRIRSTGAEVRCQAPLIRHVNDDANAWAEMWRRQVRLGAVPYYFFVERDTGPKRYFEVPLARALQIYQDAYRQVSGLCRTVRGPSMSATPGKVQVVGTTFLGPQEVFVLRFLQARDPAWVNRIFFAKMDRRASWLDDLKPFGAAEFFFERRMRELKEGTRAPTLWAEATEAEVA